jgi:hypothetical protein
MTRGGFGGIYRALVQKKSVFKINKRTPETQSQVKALENEIAIYTRLQSAPNSVSAISKMISNKTTSPAN